MPNDSHSARVAQDKKTTPTAPAGPEGQDAAWAIAVDVGGSKIAAALVSSSGCLRHQRREPTSASSEPQAVIHQICQMVDAIASAAAEETREILGVGIGIAGMTDSERGITLLASNLGWKNVPVRRLVADQVEHPVFVDSDTNVAALGEQAFGAGRDSDNFLYVNIGTGIGASMILDGRLYRGAGGVAGEFGHLALKPGGPQCGCGLRGCLEALASGRAIARRATEAIADRRPTKIQELAEGKQEDVTAALVGEAAQLGDPLALEILSDAGRYIGIGLAICTDLLNPERILLAGGVTGAKELLLKPMRAAMAEHTLPRPLRTVTVVPSGLGDVGYLIGAAALVFREERPQTT